MPPLWAATLVVLLEALTFGASFPVLAYYAEALGGGPAWVGVLFALVSLPRVVTNPVIGRLADHFGRRPLLILSTLGTLTGSITWALAPRLGGPRHALGWLAASRAITGIFGAQAPLAQSIAADVSPPQHRAAAVGLLGAAFGIAMSLGPALGGVVGHHVSLAAVGWAAAALQVLSLSVIVALLPETRRVAWAATAALAHPGTPLIEDGPAATPAAGGLRAPRARHLLLVTLVLWLGLSHLNSGYTLSANLDYGLTVEQTSYALAGIGVIGALVQGLAIRPLVGRFRERGPFLAGLVLTGIGFAAIALRPPLWLFGGATVLLGIGMALSTPCLNGMLSVAAGPDEQGGIMGLNQGITSLGRAGGAALAGGLFQRYGTLGAFSSATGLLVITLGVFAVGPRRPRPPRPCEATGSD